MSTAVNFPEGSETLLRLEAGAGLTCLADKLIPEMMGILIHRLTWPLRLGVNLAITNMMSSIT